MIEGIVGQRAFGAKMSTAESAERFGMGLVFLVTAGIATWKGVKWFRGRAPSAPLVERPPVEPPAVDPNVDPNQAPVDPNRAPADPFRAPAEPTRPGRPATRPEAPRGWRGTLNESAGASGGRRARPKHPTCRAPTKFPSER
jgi:hypothetical protein